ncbi:MAG: hypothetical protein L3J01_04170 [Thiomicrorhabdus sp.]|nr:hypothetical protein [Thiomicrorhabdus sp.]
MLISIVEIISLEDKPLLFGASASIGLVGGAIWTLRRRSEEDHTEQDAAEQPATRL